MVCLNTTAAKQTMLVGDLICSEVYSRKSCRSEALVTGDVVWNGVCSRTTDTLNKSSNNTMILCSLI